MQEMTKDSIKTLSDYFSIDSSKTINEDYFLIGSKPYALIQATTGGGMIIQLEMPSVINTNHDLWTGPHIRLFVSDSSEQKKKSHALLDSESAACLASN